MYAVHVLVLNCQPQNTANNAFTATSTLYTRLQTPAVTHELGKSNSETRHWIMPWPSQCHHYVTWPTSRR